MFAAPCKTYSKRFKLLVLVGLIASGCTSSATDPDVASISTSPPRSATTEAPEVSRSQPPTEESSTSTTVPPSPAPALAPLGDFQKGIDLQTLFRCNFLLPDARWVIEEQIVPMGATWIIIIFDCEHEPEVGPEVVCDADSTPTDEGVINVIQAAHENGLRVFLKPQIGGSVDPSVYMDMSNLDQGTYWVAWFESYAGFILHYAEMARDYDVDLFGVGSELHGVAHFTDEWRHVIAEVREVYPGALTYAATSYEIDVDTVQFWDDLDYIGVDVYWPLSDAQHPTVDELVEGWSEHVALLDRLYETWQKPIIFAEIGFRSAEGNTADPVAAWNPAELVDLETQANAYESVFQVFAEKPWWQGVYWFGWIANHLQGGPYDTGWTAQAKPAEDVVRSHYGAPARDPQNEFIIPAPAQDEDAMIIFDDAPGTTWRFENWGEEGLLDLSIDGPVHGGSAAIGVVLESAGSLGIVSDSPVFAEYDYVEFYVNLGAERRHILFLYLMDFDADLVGPGTHVALGNYAEVDRAKPLPLNEWFLVRIPLSDLNRGGDHPAALAITNWGEAGESSSVFYLDDIRLVRESTP